MAIQVTTTKKDLRHMLLFPIWETTSIFVVSVGSGHAEITETVEIEGTLKDLAIVVSTATGAALTVEVDFDDNNDIEFDANAGLAEGSTTTPTVDKVVKNFKIRVDPSGEPVGAGETFTITVYAKGI